MPASRTVRRLIAAALLTSALTGATVLAGPAPAHAAWPPVGSAVCHVAPVSGTLCGIVTHVNITIVLPGGSFMQGFLYNACAQPGDGGAPIYRATPPRPQIGTILGTVGQCRTAGLPLP